MTSARPRRRLVSAVAVLGLVLAACGGDDDSADPPDTDPPPADTDPDDGPDDTGPGDTDPDDGPDDTGPDDTDPDGNGDGPTGVDLSGVCPSPLVIQTDWFAESEHGGLYEMIGDDYTVDADNMRVRGSLLAGGEPTGIELEVRSGGPAIGFESPRVQIYTDDSIHIAYANIDAQAMAWEQNPLIAIMAPLEINPQIIMWDPDTYPEVETIADVGEAGMTINIFGGFGFADVFVAQGIWSQDQVDPSYDGSPQRFIASLDIAQQGFASAEPWTYEFLHEDYGKAPTYQLVHDAGYPTYSQTLSVLPEAVEELSDCWELFIPIAQQAQVDFVNDPDRANAIIVDAVVEFDSFWVYPAELAEYSVATMLELGLVGNGPDNTLGNLEEDRVQEVIDLIRDAGAPVPDDLVAADMFTNEFIDESIGL